MNDAFLADLHSGVTTYGGADKDGFSFRTKDFLAAADWAVSKLIEIGPERVFLLGDIYDGALPSNKIRRRFKAMVRKLSEAGIEVHILVGNHDARRLDHALEPLIEAKFPGVEVYYHPAVLEGPESTVLIYPHCEAVERQEITLRAHFLETVAYWKKTVNVPKGGVLILAGHLPVFGAADSDGHQNADEDSIRLEDLDLVGADFVFLGDFHGHQKLATKNGEAYYVGSLERVSFRDLSSSKGLMRLDNRGGRPLASFIEYPSVRPMRKLEGDLCALESGIADLGDPTGAIIQLSFVGDLVQSRDFDEKREGLKKRLMEAGARLVLVDGTVVDPKRDAEAAILREEIQNLDELGTRDIEEVIETAIESIVDDPDERKRVRDEFRDVATITGEKRKAAGIASGTIRLHGIKLHNAFRYGSDRNIIEFSRGAAEILAHPIEVQWEVDLRAKRAKELLAQWIKDNGRKMLSLVGMIDGDESESNGSGKSTVLDGISYALYEKTIREFVHEKEREKGKSTLSIVSKVNGVYAKEAYVELLFSVDDTLWLLKRGRKMSGKEKHSAILQIECLAAPDDFMKGSHSGHRLAGDEELVAELIGMSYETFCNSSMFGQFDAGQFIFGTHKIRQGIIINVLRLGIIAKYLEEVRERRKKVEDDIAGLQIQINMLTPSGGATHAELRTVPAIQDEIAKLTKTAADLDADIAKAEAVARNLRADADITAYESAKTALSLVQDLQKQKRQELASMKRDLQAQHLAAEERLNSRRTDVRNCATATVEAASAIEELRKEIAAFDRQAYDQGLALVEQAKSAKPTRSAQLKKSQGERTDLVSERSRLQGERSVAEREAASLVDLVKVATAGGVAHCPRCHSEVELAHLNQESARFESVVAESTKQEQKIDAAVAVLDKKIAEIESRIRKIDDCLGTVSGLVTSLKNFESQTERLKTQQKVHEDSVKSETKAKSEAAKEQVTVEKLVKELAEVDNRFKGEIDGLEAKVAESKAKVDDFEKRAQAAQEKAAAADRAIGVLRGDKENMVVGIATRKAEIEGIESARKARVKFEEETKTKAIALERLNTLDRLFGPNGIQTSIVERYIPLLNSYLQEYLSAVSGNRLRAVITTDGKRDGKIDIQVSGDCCDDATLVSGGEGVKLRLALDIALGLLSFARSRNAPDFICLDEVLAPVDRRTKEWVLEMLRRLQDRFRMVLVISHDEALQQAIRDRIVIDKVNGTSTVARQWWERVSAEKENEKAAAEEVEEVAV